MRRRIQIVLAVTLVVSGLVCSFSYVYVSQTLFQRVMTANANAVGINFGLAHVAADEMPDMTSILGSDDRSPVKVRHAIANELGTNVDLNRMMESVVGNWPMIQDAAILDADGKAILHSNPDIVGKTVPDRPDIRVLQDAAFRQQLHLLYNPPTIYDVRMPLQLNGEQFGSIRMGVSTLFLKNEITPKLRDAVIFSGISILHSLLLAVGLWYIALGPPGTNQPLASEKAGGDEHGPVTLKIAHP
jgi:hypothetical protein